MEKNEFRTLISRHDEIGLIRHILFDFDSRKDSLRLAKEELTKAQGRESPENLASRAQLVSALTQIAAAPHLTLDKAIEAVKLPSKPEGNTAKAGGETPVVA